MIDMLKLSWPENTSKGDLKRLEIIAKLMEPYPELVEWMFCKNKPELFGSPEFILREAGIYSSGEIVLLQVALDVWCGGGGTRVSDVCRTLDGRNFKAALEAMIELQKL